MRNPVGHLARAGRAAAVGVVVSSMVLLADAGSAVAEQGTAAQVEPNEVTFGLLGPVGLVAVVLGVLGMALGVLRQRKRARAALSEVPVQQTEPPAVADEATQPVLAPAQRP